MCVLSSSFSFFLVSILIDLKNCSFPVDILCKWWELKGRMEGESIGR